MKVLVYRGPGNTFDASARPGAKKDTVFERDGTPIEVTNELADDLLTYPGNTFVEATKEAADNGSSTH